MKTPELLDEICKRLADGEPLRAVCRDEHMPSWRTVYDWINADSDFASRIERARQLGADAIADDIIGMIDEPPERTGTQFGDKVDAGHVQWQKNRVEQRLKLLAKWHPKKYGEKSAMELTGADGGPVQISDAERAAKVAALLAVAQKRKEDDVSDLV